MKKIALFVSALLICGMANAQYFCTKNGTELHYVNYDEVGQSVSNVTTTIKNVTNVKQRIFFCNFANQKKNKLTSG